MKEKGYTRLRRGIIATTLSFSLIPFFALGVTLYGQFRVSYTSMVIENLRTLAENRRNAIDLFLDERITQLLTLAHMHSFDQITQEKYLSDVFSYIQARARSYIDIGIIDQDGRHVAYLGPYNLKGVNYKDQEWFQAVMLRGVYISDVFLGIRKFPHFIIAVMRREGNHSWILRVTIDTDIFEAMVMAAQAGKNRDAYIVNINNIYQTKPRFGSGVLEKADLPKFSKFVGTVVEEMKVNGEKAIFAKTWLRNKDWMLVIKEDPREELMPLFRAYHMGIVLVIAGVLLIVLGTLFVTRSMMRQVIRAERREAILDASMMQSSKMAALGKLAAGIAHEINNPLAVINEKAGWIKELLQEEDIAKSKNFAEFEDAITKIEHHVERAKKITHRLLGFARRMEPVQETVDVNKVLEETLKFLENEALYRGITIDTRYFEGLPLTLSDSSQLQQVFLNILTNAIDAIGKNGKITVTTDFNQKSKEIVIAISDTGPGIPKALLDKVFDPFFTTKAIGSGTGLGLSISYGIVQNLGGRIVVASEEGQGATFTIYLPGAAVIGE
jgi:two-component system NtrC family sensor kinase